MDPLAFFRQAIAADENIDPAMRRALAPQTKCPVCLATGLVAYGDHSLHRCRRCAGTGYVQEAA